MTLSVSHIISQYTNLVSPSFVFDFPIKAETDLEVLFYDNNAGTWQVLTLNVDYTVAATLDSITLSDPTPKYGAYNRLVIKRVRPYLQPTVYVTGDKFPAKATEGALDDLGMQIQQLASQTERSLHVPDHEAPLSELPAALDRAEKYLAFDSSGNVTVVDGDVTSLKSVLRQEEIATSGQTVFTTEHPYVPGANNLLVFVNGIAKIPGVDYFETNGNTVTFASGLAPGFRVTFLFGLILDARTTIYYIRALNGTQIKNGVGTLTLEARRIRDGTDSALTDGSIELYIGTTAYGYSHAFDAAEINDLAVVELKDGPYGGVLYSLTLVDVFDGVDTFLYYIKPMSGTAIKNGTGTLTIEAHRLSEGIDEHINSGTVQLYVGNTLVSQANGYGVGSNGYTGVFDSGDINGAVVVTLKDGAGGTTLDTITLVDVIDGSVGGTGTDAVYGYIEVDGSLGHTRASDQTTWTPTDATTQLDCTFVQGGVAVARAAWLVTRQTNGTFTGAPVPHKDGDLNGSRITITELNEGTAAFTVKFDYSFSGDESSVAETLISSMAGSAGSPGADASLYYIKPTAGTAIKNGTGSLTVEAHRVVGGVDSLLAAGTIQLYVGNTLVTLANGFGAGSNGYTGVFDSGDINGSVTVILKNGPAGAPLDTITLVDVDDGLNGYDGVYGYIDASTLAWVRAADQTTWTPSTAAVQLDCTFVQGGVTIARIGYLINRSSTGLLTATPGTHTLGNLNTSRITQINITGGGTQVLTIRFTYSHNGFTTSVTETFLTSLTGESGGTGNPGDPGTPALSLRLTKRALQIMAYQNGTLVASSLAAANGLLTVWSGETDVTNTATINAAFGVGCTGRINTVANSPVNGQVKGYYEIQTMSADTATLQLQAIYNGVTLTEVVTVVRVGVGYEIVTSLPSTNLFHGRMVFLTGDGKLYRYSTVINPLTGQIYGWTRAVDGADLIANSVTTNAINTGAVTAAKILVSSLSAISANIGEIIAGVLRSAANHFKIDLNNARIVFDTNPGATGGFVRIQGYAFGPNSNYLDWYGPKPSGQSTEAGIIANLQDFNALYFMKTNGLTQSAMRMRGEFEPKAWGCLNCLTTPITIRDRFNIASVTRDTTGRFTVTFQEPLPNDNYACVPGVFDNSKAVIAMVIEQATTYVRFQVNNRGDGQLNNPDRLNFVILGSNVIGGSNAASPSGGYGGGTLGLGNSPSYVQ